MEKKSLILLWILLFCMVVVYIDCKPVFESEPELSTDVADEFNSFRESKHNINSTVNNFYSTSSFEYSTSPVKENTFSLKSNESLVNSSTSSPNFQEASDHILSDRFFVENNSFSTPEYLSNVSNISLTETSLNTQPLTSEIPITTIHEEFFVTTDTESVFNDSHFPNITDSSELSAIYSVIDTLTIPPTVSEKNVVHLNMSNDIGGHSLITASVHPSSLTTDDFSNMSSVTLMKDIFYNTSKHELPDTMTLFHTDIADVVSVAINSNQTNSSDLTTQTSSENTIINSNFNDLEQYSSAAELPVKSTHTDASDFTDEISTVGNLYQSYSSDITTQSSSEDEIINSTINELEQQSSTAELTVKSTHADVSDFSYVISAVSNSDQTISSDLTTQSSSKDAIINSTPNEIDQQSSIAELPINPTPADASDFTDVVSPVRNLDQTYSKDITTKYSLEDTTINSTVNELQQQSSTAELPDKSTQADASDFPEVVSVSSNSDQTISSDLSPQSSSEDTTINSTGSELEQQSSTAELPDKSTQADASDFPEVVSISSNSDQTISSDLIPQSSSEDTTINSTGNELEQQSSTTELPIKSTHTDASEFTDAVSSVSNSYQTDSSDLTTKSSSKDTVINSTVSELEQQSLVTELPTKFTEPQSDVFTTATEIITSESSLTSHSSTDYSETINKSSTTKLFEDTISSQVPEVTELISTEITSLGSTFENNTTESDISVCNVCQNCTDGYIDRVISDVTAGLPNSLELPNRQGRFQLYHGQLFGLKTLKRSERALVACIDNYNYLVMVPLRIQDAKAFYKWQVEMPLRTFYGDMNVTIANTECRVFYSHSKDGSLVEGLKITALDGIETQFSGMGPLNSMMAGFTRTWISVFKRSFAKTIENTLVHVINKELQDVKKYKEFYDIKQRDSNL